LYFTSSKEIKRACEKMMPYDFTYFILICKLYKSEKPQTKKKKKKQQQSDEPEIVWSNPEEEIINQVCGTSLERVLCRSNVVLLLHVAKLCRNCIVVTCLQLTVWSSSDSRSAAQEMLFFLWRPKLSGYRLQMD
jgi:hypothetical protein